MSPLLAAVSGLGFGLSLIIAIGAQNAFVLRQGLRREHVLAVVAICALADAALIILGIAGIGAVLESAPWLLVVIRWGGIVFLLAYAVLAARRALRPGMLEGDPAGASTSLRTAIGTCLALTLLNPHVYLDTVVLLGSVANTHGDERWWFGAGAALGSVLWFTALGFGARALRPLFRSRTAWRVLDGAVAVVMVVLAVSLALSS
ncbi:MULTISPECIES: LysE/ArgO family amino acid transporter [unclassified Rathayibacter]|uniref:LysE/ArgO family amino acid transporter n=1 Tax=unclassified Rathayibacter TaxID=2609250 RepID=UPI001FB686E7|nr:MULTISPECIES: LysE/ArgO family amino acid transporter [unclassified Rathayibacter]